jgi:hypothetical protein
VFRPIDQEAKMTAARTDIHRPSAAEFDPADYEFVAVHDNGAEWPGANLYFAQVRRELIDAGWTFSGIYGGAGKCDHCGAVLRYSALMKHLPTRTLIYIGETCLDNRFEMTKGEFDAARKAAQLDRERQGKLRAFNELCQDMPELVWATYAQNIGSAGLGDHRADLPALPETWGERNRKGWAIGVLSDLARKVRQYGSFASEKQAALLVRLVHELEVADAETAKREAERAAKAAARTNAAIGEIGERREFTGTVRWFDHFTDFYGYSEKTSTVMILDTPEGTVKWKASNYIELEKGQTVKIRATVKEHSIYDRTQEITTVVTRGKVL